MSMVQAVGTLRSNTKVMSIIYMTGIFTMHIRGMWMNMPWRRVARIRPLAPQLMPAARMTPSTLMGLVVDMKRFRTAVIKTIS